MAEKSLEKLAEACGVDLPSVTMQYRQMHPDGVDAEGKTVVNWKSRLHADLTARLAAEASSVDAAAEAE